MQCVIEPSKSYTDIDCLRHDLALMDVQETESFRLDQMNLTTNGTVQVSGIGEFPLTEISLRDALRRGGMHVSACENFFSENKNVLDQVIVDCANAYYVHSRYAGNEIKLVTRADEKERFALGIPSARYALLSHSQALESILKNLRPDLKLSRANVFPEFFEISFTDPLNTARDAVGEIVETGLCYLNSQGTRTRALVAAAYSNRLVCLNGAVAKDRLFSVRYPHKGNILNGEFSRKTSEILEKFSVMMKNLPQLGTIPITDKFISQLKPGLNETIGVKESTKFVESIDQERETVMHVWNKVTNLPHRISQPDKKLQLEHLGFHILTTFLHKN